MKASERSIRPSARVEGLIVKELPDEVLVYDLESHKAHCLNRPAAAIWKHFDGRTTIAEVAARAAGGDDGPLDSEVVLLALKQLRKANLILGDDEQPRTHSRVTRRDLMKRLGLAATLLPLVTSILAPTAFAAVSCGAVQCFVDANPSVECQFATNSQCNRCLGGRCLP